MKKEAVMHIPLSQYAYAESEHVLNIRIRTAKKDIVRCRLFYGDRVDLSEPIRTKQVDMEKTVSDDLFDYFEARIEDKYTRVCYFFLLDDGETQEYYYSRGFCRRMDAHRTEYFQFPYIRREDIPDIPAWAQDMIMYHIFPDSFASGERQLSGEGQEKRLGRDALSVSKTGGTLSGIRANLSYLQELGVNCIYINPIFAAHSYHKYDTVDYFKIDPCLGTTEDLKDLVSACHQRGIRVILDGVFNHCGTGFFAFQDVLKYGRESAYYDWFYEMPLPIVYQDPPNYEAFAYVKEMPKLNTGNPEVVDYFCKVGSYWIRESDIDGWRLDVANEINHDFWRAFRKAVRREKEDCFLIAEIWEEAGIWLAGDQFDSTMNYTFSYLCRDLFAQSKLSIREFDEQIGKMLMRYPYHTNLCQMNFLDTHDVPRFLSYCGGDVSRLKLAVFYMMTAVGIPSVFYGDEMEIAGVTEPEYRNAMPWKEKEQHRELIDFFKQLIHVRRGHDALRKGDYRTVLADDDRKLYGYKRRSGQEEIVLLLNLGEEEAYIRVSEFGAEGGADLLYDRSLKAEEVLPAHCGCMWKL
ncbi:MAG: glycoside hydrolase family 13 protein [Lachnospiraceae bacterium]|nr:glycoside hydrolase family 13 protein [Lachnospiraceae bacterium]